MDIQGLDYNTQRDRLVMPEYGREVQRMVEHAISLPEKAEREACAKAIVRTMERMNPQVRQEADYQQKLWDQLAIMSDFKLDIDWPYDVSEARKMQVSPEPIEYPRQHIPIRHYGSMVFELFEKLESMPEGPERDELAALTANQMKRDLVQWSHGSSDDEKVVSDLAKYTHGVIQLDLNTFRFAKVEQSLPNERGGKRRRR